MKKFPVILAMLLIRLTNSSCTEASATSNPPNYNLAKPQVFKMPSVLEEISGITFNHGNADTIFAEQDEEGKLFYLHLGDETVKHIKFSKRGDFEDVAICNGRVIMLRSDGVLFSFPLNTTGTPGTDNVKEENGLLPAGEYESLYADESANSLYLLCKNCSDDKSGQITSGFIMTINANGQLSVKSKFTVNDNAVATLSGKEKLRLKPSGLAQHPLSHEWYIISSINKMLLVTDARWKPLAVYPLNPASFTQPEGIAFDKAGNLYISNEKGNAEAGSVLKFNYQKK